ncbi:MAG: TolC family protein [Verrucomicrobiales bacterium]|nr:TolC family protein [Verrucomicrobiales bacterium]
MKRILRVCVVAVGLLLLPALRAQESAPETNQWVSLDTLVEEALQRNPELRVAEAGIAAARGEAITAKAYQNPEVSFTPGAKRVSPEGEPGETYFHGVIGAGQVIEYPGKRTVRKALAERSVAGSRIALESLRYQIQLQVRKAYYDLLAAQQIEGLRQEQVESARVFAAAARQRTESGYASDFESLKAEADFIAAQKLLRESQGHIATAKVALNAMAGRPPTAQIRVAGALDGNFQLPGMNLLDFALTNNPALRIQSVENEKAGLGVRAAKLSGRPDFTVGPAVEFDKEEQVYGLSISLPLPFWNRGKGEIQTATAAQQKAMAETERLRLEIVRAVTTAEQNLITANSQLALYTPEFRDRLRALVGQAEKSYAQSATTLLIYLDARRTYFDTLADYNESLAAAAGARAELESAVGVPLDSNIPKP